MGILAFCKKRLTLNHGVVYLLCQFFQKGDIMKKKLILTVAASAVLVLAGCGGSTSSAQNTAIISGSQGAQGGLSGIANFMATSYDEKAKITAQLEGYALDNFLSGIPLYDSGSKVLYSNRLTIPASKYIPNFGFGVGYGTINSDMDAETNSAWKRYYHTYETEEPSTFNYMNSSDSVTADMYSYFADAYYGTRLNAAKDGYEWYSSLASEMPIALNADKATGLATKWRVKVHANDSKYVYNTLSSVAAVKAFAGRKIALADYLTPFKLMCDNNWYRANSDLASPTSGFKGVASYVIAKSAGRTPSWDNVGIQINEAESSIDFEFVSAKSQFYAMYNLGSSLFSPVPEDFITAIGGAANYGKSLTIDSVLSVGTYVLEAWDQGVDIVFKKNPLYFNSSMTSIAGQKVSIYTAAQSDSTYIIKLFEQGGIDAAGLPTKDYIEKYASDPRLRQTLGDTVWKMQTNSCTKDQWVKLFGTQGTISPHSSESDYWDVKPIMSNHNFLNGLYYAVDRKGLCEVNGRNPAQGFLADAYMSDPEKNVAYRDTDAAKAVLANRSPETYGFDKEAAKAYFKKAIDEEIAKGDYAYGTEAAPTVITIQMMYQTQSQINNEGSTLAGYFQDAFNAIDPRIQLKVNTYTGTNWYDVYYSACMTGDFDLSFASISGNTLDPLSFMNVLCSDNRSEFTLSWGPDTSVTSSSIQYDGYNWSYDALFSAACNGAVVEDGAEAQLITFTDVSKPEVYTDTDKKEYAKMTVKGTIKKFAGVEVTLQSFTYCDGATGTVVGASDFDVDPVVYTDNGDGTISFVAQLKRIFAANKYVGQTDYDEIYMYYNLTINGASSVISQVFGYCNCPNHGVAA
jgi:hypothetical protein